MLKVGDLSNLVKQAQQMHERMAQIQKNLENITVQGSAGGGMVTCKANARQEILEIKIEPEIIDPEDIEMLENLVVAAVNQALMNAQERANEEISRVTGGLLSKLPGGLKLP